jgi:hypothetical protein
MNSKKTKIILLISLILFVGVTTFFVFVHIKIREVKSESVLIGQRIIENRRSVATFDSLKKNISDIEASSEKIDSFFIKKDEVVSFLDTLESLASTTNTKISIQTVSDKKVAPMGSVIVVGLNAQGSYSNIHKLIRLLEEMPYQTEIQNINLSSENGADNKNQAANYWSANITLLGLML